MNFSEAKQEFDLRYYRWSLDQFEREIECSFSMLRRFKFGSPKSTCDFMTKLCREDQSTLARSLVKRMHPRAVRILGEEESDKELRLREKRDGSFTGDAGFAAEVSARRRSGERLNFAKRGQIKKALINEFLEKFGSACIDLDNVGHDPEVEFKMNIAGWIVTSFFDFGAKGMVFYYSHSIASQERFDYVGVKWPMLMGSMISFNSALGISSQTEWEYVLPDDIQGVVQFAVALCGRFFEALPMLLEGLNPTGLTPDQLDIPGF
jgi:hypothetical protein